MKPAVLHEEAQREFDEAVDYYNARQRGLGEEFFEIVLDAVTQIENNPLTGVVSANGTRTLTTPPFKYGIIFEEYSDHVLVWAVAHLSRDSGYWVSRKKDRQ